MRLLWPHVLWTLCFVRPLLTGARETEMEFEPVQLSLSSALIRGWRKSWLRPIGKLAVWISFCLATGILHAGPGDLLREYANPSLDHFHPRFGSVLVPTGTSIYVGAPRMDRGQVDNGAAFRLDAASGEVLSTCFAFSLRYRIKSFKNST